MRRSLSDLPAFRHDPLGFLIERASRSPRPLEPLAIGRTPHYLVTDPELARTLLKSEEEVIDKGRLVRKLRRLLGKSFLTMSGAEHRRRREVLHHQLARGVANRYVPAMAAVVRQTAARIVHEQSFDAHAITAPLALNLACVALFGSDVLSSGDRQALIGAMKMTEDELADEMFRAGPVWPWTFAARWRRRSIARDMMSFVVRRVQQSASDSSVLRALGELQLTDRQICDEIITMLVAGHHTTGTAGAWILHHLAVEPGLAERISREAKAVSDENGEVKASALKDASISLALVREVLRLYPSAWWFSRETKRTALIAGEKLERGTSLIISPWQLHRDRRFWSEPHRFRLDRSFNTPAYMPFGAGPRACVGMGVAALELQLLALEFAAAYELESLTASPVPWPKASVTLIPPPLELSLRLRREIRAGAAA